VAHHVLNANEPRMPDTPVRRRVRRLRVDVGLASRHADGASPDNTNAI